MTGVALLATSKKSLLVNKMRIPPCRACSPTSPRCPADRLSRLGRVHSRQGWRGSRAPDRTGRVCKQETRKLMPRQGGTLTPAGRGRPAAQDARHSGPAAIRIAALCGCLSSDTAECKSDRASRLFGHVTIVLVPAGYRTRPKSVRLAWSGEGRADEGYSWKLDKEARWLLN
jgi:hypothetical protein